MHTAPRFLAALLAAGLALAAPAAAQTETTDLLITSDDCSNGPFTLSYYAGAASSGACNMDPQGGWAGDADDAVFTAVNGLPLSLDTSRPVHVEVQTTNYLGLPMAGAFGDQTVTVTLAGKRQGSNQTVPLGTASTTTPATEMAQTADVLYAFDIAVPADKAGVYRALTLSTNVAGSVLGGYVEVKGPSFVSYPIVDGTAPVEEE